MLELIVVYSMDKSILVDLDKKILPEKIYEKSVQTIVDYLNITISEYDKYNIAQIIHLFRRIMGLIYNHQANIIWYLIYKILLKNYDVIESLNSSDLKKFTEKEKRTIELFIIKNNILYSYMFVRLIESSSIKEYNDLHLLQIYTYLIIIRRCYPKGNDFSQIEPTCMIISKKLRSKEFKDELKKIKYPTYPYENTYDFIKYNKNTYDFIKHIEI